MNKGWYAVLAAMLILAIVLRVILVSRGGQFFYPDESRYAVSRDAADLIVHGKWKQGLDLPLAGGDHVGFKFLGIIPALVEQATHRNSHIPALFLAACSLGTIILLGTVARRMDAGPAAHAWIIIAGAASTALFYNTRHLLPYDLSMFLGTLGWAVGLRRGSKRAALAGFIIGWAILSYYGYWTFGAVVLSVIVLCPATGWMDGLKRALCVGAGVLSAIALPIGVDALFGKGTLIAGARLLSASITSGDFRAHIVPWLYLWSAEKFWFLLAIASVGLLGFGIVRRIRNGERSVWHSPEFVAVAAVILLWVFFLVTANGLHKFVVHGRLVRQMVPFLVLALGIGMSMWLENKPRWVSWLAGTILALNMVFAYWTPLSLRFPAEFQAEWAPYLQHSSETASPETYERFVNVTHYVFEPEVLRHAPLETIAASPHPFEYAPYLYEGFTPEERTRRRSVDHRMRVVRMPVQPEARVRGEPYGVVTAEVRFGEKRGGFIEPLISVGPRGAGDVFFVRYVTDNILQFGMESIGNVLVFSDQITVDMTRTHKVECFSGTLLPGPGQPNPPGISEAARAAGGRLVWMRVDGEVLLNEYSSSHVARPEQVFAGANVANAGAVSSQFSGSFLSVHRGGLPPLPEQLANSAYGPIRLVCGPARGELGRPEPLLVVGEAGKAVLCYIIPLENNTARFGVEIWGRGTWQSEPVGLKPNIANEILCSFGSLYPIVGAEKWGKTSMPDQRLLKRRVQIRVNGASVLEFTAATPDWAGAAPAIAVGTNPAGGSVVLPKYLGEIGTWQQEPIERALQ